MGHRDEEIIARLRRFYEAFNRGDYDAAIEVAHPAIEFVRAMGQSSLHGADALREWMRPDAFEEQQIEGSEFRVSENKVPVRSHAHGRGAGSGYLDHQRVEALEAAGLSE